ncbi:LysM peptidoglycan-binding domain-containing protein [Lactiplantibacillus pentosus]|uniref:LysM peptidoglycan-binding domain-containing protein n=1 Tax=Lactiplantibacillus pentosus TaxID=1589 RepID=A0AB37RGX6_LACPE|nr:LysM domain-containing protein [Lactiplantibacillus pentosus]RMW43715.1 LysM peptidoglycan-binding domain-containing protein [Lactiplantibacillus pentosus]RMW45742.1 LysM peptidoglycan-binding domain-containing protein [Lactiplantibacillus pentosus]RMW54065.1 LysM peptidoglycan-binding domain-containing protein [Lactiplantibacillus pentosus]RMW54721.1 LysM peptidoglycan-binding domain-containing protein [Lactiplantibacillus pentosus]
MVFVKTGASHTYYTVVSGDSWWSIAQRNGLSVYTLVAQNCNSIYPGTLTKRNHRIGSNGWCGASFVNFLDL